MPSRSALTIGHMDSDGLGKKTTTHTRERNDKHSRKSRVSACSNCRARKTKCDGRHPGCKTCEIYHDTCRYDKPPSMSTIKAMSQKLNEYENYIRQIDQKSPLLVNSNIPAPFERGRGLPVFSGERNPRSTTSLSTTDGSPKGTTNKELSDLPLDVVLDEHGNPYYHGPTSSVYDPSRVRDWKHKQTQVCSPRSDIEVRKQLADTAAESRVWEEFALENASLRTKIPNDVIAELLQLHWSWIAPMFMWVYRPAFMRDMSTGGKYCSEFLLTVLCAHSARFRNDQIGDSLISRARLLLGTEIQKPSCTASVQALLQLSARDLAFGLTSQAWLYSGMAFRMVSDLGLYHSGSNGIDVEGMSAEDVEIRRRLFWSCYFWDKAISLYLGRSPMLKEMPSNDRPYLLDDSAEHELWSPFYGFSVQQASIPAVSYIPQKAHAISCFENSCRLSVIISEIIEQLYSRRVASATESVVRGISERLSTWRINTPAHLRYDTDNLPLTCGPPHILTQNLLYHTTAILLHRPFCNSSGHQVACRAAADSIETLLRHFEDTFGFTRITYLMAYCVYLGASVMVQGVKSRDPAAEQKIQTFLRALSGSCQTCPGVQRSLDIIRNSLSKSVDQTISAIDHVEERQYTFLPVFPHREPHFPQAENIGGAAFDVNDFSMLDSFPEEHLDFEGSDWFTAY